MKSLIYLTAIALLGIAFTLAQNTQSTKPSSDASNSSNMSSQAPAGQTNSQQQQDDQDQVPSPQQLREQGEAKHAVPDPTVRDQQGSTPSTTGASGSNAPTSPSTMGTTGSTPPEAPSTTPQNATPPDQQPNSTTGPAAASPHAQLMQTPSARAMHTHTPDPGTCMNPAALETTAEGSQPPQQPCR
jgi:hypothetical protein